MVKMKGMRNGKKVSPNFEILKILVIITICWRFALYILYKMLKLHSNSYSWGKRRVSTSVLSDRRKEHAQWRESSQTGLEGSLGNVSAHASGSEEGGKCHFDGYFIQFMLVLEPITFIVFGNIKISSNSFCIDSPKKRRKFQKKSALIYYLFAMF